MSMNEPHTDTHRSVFDGFVTLAEFARAVGRTERTVRRWHRQGLPVAKRGSLRMINLARATAWLEAGERGGLAPTGRRTR